MIKEQFANHLGYSDINPYEVVNVVSDKTIEIREMDAVRDTSVKMEFVPGGFSAICTNQYDQKWGIKPNTNNKVFRIRLSKNKGWRDAHGRRFQLSDTPRKFYDYNF
jgi:hypothetical protein